MNVDSSINIKSLEKLMNDIKDMPEDKQNKAIQITSATLSMMVSAGIKINPTS